MVGGWVAQAMWWVAQAMWWVAGPTYILQPLRGPTCKIARFQAELKFPSWTECGNELQTLQRPTTAKNLIQFFVIIIKIMFIKFFYEP